MRFEETRLAGVFVVDVEPHADERGLFARTFCRHEFAERGLEADFVQCNVSYNRRRGTLRGMHYQRPPYGEGKLVRCVAGAAYDVVVDLRPGSATRTRWVAIELSAANRRAVYIPPGLAHGFQTLADDTELFYQMAAFYRPGHAAGVRWDDPAFAIEWPLADPIMAERDAGWPDFAP